ncbi:MAG: SusD/RagB family nutrient-binding outer membrane lipoprotein, partial [Bacteroidetes bacterium]|nr:SusD/RagB family nutrient-binding outer membrane lipoprotein [Bacteroidota bacterium]
MKHKNIMTAIMIFILGTSLLSSCSKTFFSNANTNPNAPAPSSILPSTLLSTVEGSLAYTQGGDLSRFTQYFTQQTLGAYNQSSAYYTYVITSQDVDQLWGNLYTSVMENADTLVGLSDAKMYYAYSGIGRILKAYALQITVDTWGSVPYTDAFKGSNEFSAKYDVDSTLYNTIIIGLLDDGLYYLKNTSLGQSGPNATPGTDDIIYNGNLSNWIKFAHAIKARIYLHQSKANPAMAVNALTEIDSAFTSNADIAQFIFGDAPTANNPVFQFNDQRAYTD